MSKYVLTVVTDGSGLETNAAAQREAAKIRRNGFKVEGTSSVYLDAAGKYAVDLTWSEGKDGEDGVTKPETFEDKLKRLSTVGAPPESRPLEEQPKSAGERDSSGKDPNYSSVLVPSGAMRGALDEAAGGLDADATKEIAKEPSAKPVGKGKKARKTTTAATPIRRARKKKDQ